jgi:uncharacterized protein
MPAHVNEHTALHGAQPRQRPAAAVAALASRVELSEGKRRTVLLAPLVLIASMYMVFEVDVAWLGPTRGYMAAFALYWIAWGFALPIWLLGLDGFVDLFAPGKGNRWGLPSMTALPLLAAPALFGFLFVFPTSFPAADTRVLLAIAGYAIVNGVLEEAFWRGLFVRAFPNDRLYGVLYPALAFALWQLVPMTKSPSAIPAGAAAVVGTGLITGLLFGWVAWRTGSVRWTAMAHSAMNLSGIGALVAFFPR